MTMGTELDLDDACAGHPRARRELDALREALALAYGHLWCINEQPGTPEPIYDAMQASYEARKILRGLLTTEQRGNGIHAARAARKGKHEQHHPV
jgi:hypothetical protein